MVQAGRVMDTILENLLDVSWWVGQFLPVAMLALAAKVASYMGRRTKKALRGSKARKLRLVKSIRRDDLLISREMLKASALFVVFVVSLITAGVLLLFVGAPHQAVSVIAASIPILWSEWAWLSQDGLVKEVLARRAKLRKR